MLEAINIESSRFAVLVGAGLRTAMFWEKYFGMEASIQHTMRVTLQSACHFWSAAYD